MKGTTIFSQVILQMVLFFSGYYLILLYVGMLVLLCYKGLALPYPSRNFWSELILLLMLAIIDGFRIFLAVKGNLTRRKIPLLISLILLVPVFVGYLYLTLWQTYVLTLELVIMVIGFVGALLQLIISPFVLWIFHRTVPL